MLKILKYFNTKIRLDSIISTDDVNIILRNNIEKEKLVTIIKDVDRKEEVEKLPNKTDFSKIEVKLNDKLYLVNKHEDKIVYEEKPMYSKIEKILNGKLDKPDNIDKFVYDLPIPNINPEIISLEEVLEIKKKQIITPTINLFNMLDINKTDSYEEFENKLINRFNFKNDLYENTELEYIKTDLLVKNDIVENQNNKEIITRDDREQLYSLNNDDRNKNILITYFKNDIIPINRIKDDEHMEVVRNCYDINLNMPGSIEFEDPNRFIPDLRPIEDFKKLPIIPVSDILKRDFNEKLEKYHRNKFVFEIKRESIFNSIILCGTFLIGYMIINFIWEKDEEISIEYERKKLEKIMNS